MERTTTIQLGPNQSAKLREAGEVFIAVGRESFPGDPSRYVLHLIPCTPANGDAACSVAKGSHRAVRIPIRDVTPATG